MSLQPEVQPGAKSVTTVEPLCFRSLEEFVDLAVPVPDRFTNKNESIQAVDFEASLRAAHEQGKREAMAMAAEQVQQQVDAERASVTKFVRQFEEEKQRYFSEVEGEVVRLSLAIAERVLHREAGMDPMLLARAARVALDQVADSSEAVLRVAASEAAQWNEVLKVSAKGMVIEADHELPRGEAVLKTRSGTVQLGLKAQLQEIEHGFFELLGRRPALSM